MIYKDPQTCCVYASQIMFKKNKLLPVQLVLKYLNLGKPFCKKKHYFRHCPKVESDKFNWLKYLFIYVFGLA